MELEFLNGTKVAVIRNLISDQDSATLHNYAVEIKKAETLETREYQDIYDEKSFIQLDDSLDIDLAKLKSSWGAKNVHTRFGPDYIKDIVEKVKEVSASALTFYLKAIDNPKQNFRHLDLNYDPIHAYSAGHALDNHVDLHEFALVFYVSDPSEFFGGDLVYDAGPRVTPTRGTLVIAPSGMPHQVLEVTDGWRCSLTTFLSCTD
jgi:hypothetical protein